jgi:hypothetical protein
MPALARSKPANTIDVCVAREQVAKEAVFKQHQRKSKAVREEKAAAWAKKVRETEAPESA